MGKKIITVFSVAFVLLLALSCQVFAEDEPYTNQTLDGLVSLEIPLEKTFTPSDVNGSLGSVREYYTNGSDGNFRNGSLILFYWDESVLNESEGDLLDYVIDDLTSTYSYNLNQNDDDLIILENDADMCGIPPFLAGKSDEGGRVVLIGGQNLHELESYAGTIEFLK